MKAFYSQVEMRSEESFCVRHNFQRDVKGSWHYHPELELHYIVKGTGMRFIGDNISAFAEGDIVLIGEHVPHCWRHHTIMADTDAGLEVETITLQFKADCLGPYLANLPEAYQLPVLYEKARRGMQINGHAREATALLMKEMLNANGLARIILLLKILKILAECREYTAITLAEHRFFPADTNDFYRLNQICNYTLNNFGSNIRLKDVAESSNLNKTSFCRYFKLVTKKNYSSFLTQVRISQACQRLIENRYSINVICYECGFNNVANFYRHFKKVTGMTPSKYKEKYLKSNEMNISA